MSYNYKLTVQVPLFHTHSLAPTLKLAFTGIEKYAQREGLEVLGFYFANGNGSLDLPLLHRSIADKLVANSRDGLGSVWVLEASRVPFEAPAFKGVAWQAGKDASAQVAIAAANVKFSSGFSTS